jgi:hypothetical protein
MQNRLQGLMFTPFGLAAAEKRWLRSEGLTPDGKTTLGVFFINGADEQKQRFRASARAWLADGVDRHLDFAFDVERPRARIRVTFGAGGNWSYIGRDALRASTPQTMNIESINDPRVYQHEIGHALGLLHEHQHPTAGFSWNERAVLREVATWGGRWAEEDYIRHNILRRLSHTSVCIGDPNFNPESVMIYGIPSRWTYGTFESSVNLVSARDRRCVYGLYADQ